MYDNLPCRSPHSGETQPRCDRQGPITIDCPMNTFLDSQHIPSNQRRSLISWFTRPQILWCSLRGEMEDNSNVGQRRHGREMSFFPLSKARLLAQNHRRNRAYAACVNCIGVLTAANDGMGTDFPYIPQRVTRRAWVTLTHSVLHALVYLRCCA